jgi:hypothetical protein
MIECTIGGKRYQVYRDGTVYIWIDASVIPADALGVATKRGHWRRAKEGPASEQARAAAASLRSKAA